MKHSRRRAQQAWWLSGRSTLWRFEGTEWPSTIQNGGHEKQQMPAPVWVNRRQGWHGQVRSVSNPKPGPPAVAPGNRFILHLSDVQTWERVRAARTQAGRSVGPAHQEWAQRCRGTDSGQELCPASCSLQLPAFPSEAPGVVVPQSLSFSGPASGLTEPSPVTSDQAPAGWAPEAPDSQRPRMTATLTCVAFHHEDRVCRQLPLGCSGPYPLQTTHPQQPSRGPEMRLEGFLPSPCSCAADLG